MGSLIAYTHVIARDSLGQFIAKTERAARAAVREAAEAGRDEARARAPFKTGALQSTIHAVELRPMEWAITVGTDHWKPQEYGARPHDITGNVRFFWENAPGGPRPWTPGSNTIRHPGNIGLHFMQAGKEVAVDSFRAALHRNFR